MTLGIAPSTAAAAWLDLSHDNWHDTATKGPHGFPERVSVPCGDSAIEECQILRVMLAALRPFTTTPELAYHCLWDGWGLEGAPGENAPFGESDLARATFGTVARTYVLFAGDLADACEWGAREVAPGIRRPMMTPAFVWPADQAWCVAKDIDADHFSVVCSKKAASAVRGAVAAAS